MNKKPADTSGRRKGKAKPQSSPDTQFRRWLEEQLHQRYDNVLNEPIPDDLLSLLKPEGREPGDGGRQE